MAAYTSMRDAALSALFAIAVVPVAQVSEKSCLYHWHFPVGERVPEHIFYGRLKDTVDLRFLYPLTKGCNGGGSGQKGHRPGVFLKTLFGRLSGEHHQRSQTHRPLFDAPGHTFFIGYDLYQELPWHGTVSRTRQLFPESVFGKVFSRSLSPCVENGMVSGHTKAIDSAPVKTNARMDTLELKVLEDDLDEHLRRYVPSAQ